MGDVFTPIIKSTIRIKMYRGLYGKRGRPPKNWKPPFKPVLYIRRGYFRLIFDEGVEGDLRDLMMN